MWLHCMNWERANQGAKKNMEICQSKNMEGVLLAHETKGIKGL